MKSNKKFKRIKAKRLVNRKMVKGFTLVELIIVIAIIGILAAILIPTMTGKVKEARMKTANDAAAKVAEYASITITEMDAKGTPLNFSNECFCASVFDKEVSDSSSEYTAFKTAMENAMPQLKDSNVHWAVAFNAEGSVVATAYREHGSNYIGTYPEPKKEPYSNSELGDGMNKNVFMAVSPAYLRQDQDNDIEWDNQDAQKDAGNEGNEGNAGDGNE